MNSTLKALLSIPVLIVSIALVISLYFAENIWGYYRFKVMCAKESGLKIYQPLEPNSGWWVNGGSVYDAIVLVSFKEVAFIRYRDKKDGNLYDVYSTPRQKISDEGYARKLADMSQQVLYEYKYSNPRLENEIRMSIVLEEFIDLSTSKVMARYQGFTHSKFNPDNTLLGANSGEQCPEDLPLVDFNTGKRIPMKRDLAISSIFIK
jgi:hypothetical protein